MKGKEECMQKTRIINSQGKRPEDPREISSLKEEEAVRRKKEEVNVSGRSGVLERRENGGHGRGRERKRKDARNEVAEDVPRAQRKEGKRKKNDTP